jgi:hypothetical protein
MTMEEERKLLETSGITGEGFRNPNDKIPTKL